MPESLIGLITLEHFHTLSGLAGIGSAFVILIFWSRGL